MKRNQKYQFWSLGKMRLGNFSVLLSLLPLFLGGFFGVTTAGKAEARHREECCVVVAQNFPPAFEDESPFDDRFYEVFVPTYSDDLLFLVRDKVYRQAQPINRRGRTVITLGRYDLNGARRRVRDLMREGITAEMVARDGSHNSVLPDYGITRRYIVFVPGGRNFDNTLFRVQTVIPEAFPWQYGGRDVIVVGQFSNQSDALQLRNYLKRQGIRAQFVRNTITPAFPRISRTEINPVVLENRQESRFAGIENQVPQNVTYIANNSYTVVIPGRGGELAAIEGQVRQMAIDLGIEDQVLIQYDANQTQLIVGPFDRLEAAQDWQNYLQESGINNARISNGN